MIVEEIIVTGTAIDREAPIRFISTHCGSRWYEIPWRPLHVDCQQHRNIGDAPCWMLSTIYSTIVALLHRAEEARDKKERYMYVTLQDRRLINAEVAMSKQLKIIEDEISERILLGGEHD